MPAVMNSRGTCALATRLSGKVSEIKAFPSQASESREDELAALRNELARETALRKRYETQLRQLSASLPIVILMADEQRNVTFISDNWYDLTGTGRQDLGNWIATVHPEDRHLVADELIAATDQRRRYAVGRNGLEVDLVEAHKWFNLAAMSGDERAQLDRSEVAASMTPAEVAAAQREARAFLMQTRH